MAESVRELREPTESQNVDCIRRIAAGDQQAMGALYDTTQSMVYGVALRIVDDRTAAEDVVIEAYAQCWRQAGRFDPLKGTVMAWLFNITRSRAIDVVRARRSRPQTSSLDDVVREVCSEEPGPSELIVGSENCRIVRSALAALAPGQREAIELAYFSDLSHSQIAARLHQPLGTVKTRIRDGMSKLRESLSTLAEASERRQA